MGIEKHGHAATLVVLAMAAACAVNPGTGRRQLSLIGEQREIVDRPRSGPRGRRLRGSLRRPRPAETLALVNRLRPGDRVRSGARVKVVTGGELP